MLLVITTFIGHKLQTWRVNTVLVLSLFLALCLYNVLGFTCNGSHQPVKCSFYFFYLSSCDYWQWLRLTTCRHLAAGHKRKTGYIIARFPSRSARKPSPQELSRLACSLCSLACSLSTFALSLSLSLFFISPHSRSPPSPLILTVSESDCRLHKRTRILCPEYQPFGGEL